MVANPKGFLERSLIVFALLGASCAPLRPPPERPLEVRPLVTFAVIGDTHTIGTPTTGKAGYSRIIEQVNEIGPDLLVHVGDMIVAPAYFFWDPDHPGQASVDTFMAYTRRLDPSIEFFPVLGNHEGDIDGFAFAIEAFPQFPGRGWYAFDHGRAHFFIIENNSDTRDSTLTGYRFSKPNGGLNTPGSEQRRWLEDDLDSRSGGTRWTFGFGHRAYYGGEGKRARPNIYEARVGLDSFCELIERAGTDVFFNGDMHCYTRTAPIRSGEVASRGERGTIYVTAGGGGGRIARGKVFPDSSILPPGAFQAGTNTRHFFILCEVYESLFRGQAIDTSGVVFDRWEIRK